MNPWICPRCGAVNGPVAMMCQNNKCAQGPTMMVSGTTNIPSQPFPCVHCGDQVPCGKTHPPAWVDV